MKGQLKFYRSVSYIFTSVLFENLNQAFTILFLLPFLLLGQLSGVQKSHLDSLNQVIVSAEHDTTVVKSLIEAAGLLAQFDEKQQLQYLNKADSLSSFNIKTSSKNRMVFQKLNIQALHETGSYYYKKSLHNKAIQYWKKELNLLHQLDERKRMATI